MTSDLDIWRAATLLIKGHGEDAEIVASQRADQMLDRGDRDGQLVWMRIRRAIRRATSGSDRAGALKRARRATAPFDKGDLTIEWGAAHHEAMIGEVQALMDRGVGLSSHRDQGDRQDPQEGRGPANRLDR